MGTNFTYISYRWQNVRDIGSAHRERSCVNTRPGSAALHRPDRGVLRLEANGHGRLFDLKKNCSKTLEFILFQSKINSKTSSIAQDKECSSNNSGTKQQVNIH